MLVAALALAPAALADDFVETPAGDAGFVVMGSKTGNGAGIVRIRTDEDNNGTYEHAAAPFFPYPGLAVGDGVRVAIGDFNGDGNEELVTAAGKGVPVDIWAINPDGSIGDLIDSKKVFGSRGVFVAAGDIDNDGVSELVTAAASGQPTVKTFHDTDADLKVFDNPIETFLAFPGTFHGGVRVTVGNTNNVGGGELITAQGTGGRQIKVWTDSDADAQVSDLATNPIIETFPAYGGSFKGGLYVSSAAISSVGTGGAELVVGPGAGKQKVKIFSDVNANGHVSDDPVFESFFPYGSSWDKGVRVGLGDTDHSGFFVEALTAPGAAGGSKPVKIYDDSADAGSFLTDNALAGSFIGAAGNAGVYPAFGRVFTGTYSFGGFPQTIADTATLNTTLTVPASAGKIRDLDIAINLFHSFDGDLDVTLTHVSTGTSVVLFTDVGSSNEGFLVRLSDEVGTDIATATNPKVDGPIAGFFSPEAPALLSAFDGQDASGVWRLTIVDDSGGDSGTLYDWSLFVGF
jgi:hypothetical protein